MPRALSFLSAELASLSELGALRTPSADAVADASLRNACSNDYLGLGANRGALSGGGLWGATGSRLVTGDSGEVRALESEVASWVHQPASLVFSSGYAANVGLISALAGRGDLIVSDERNHASLVDGCRLSRAAVRVTRHLDVDEVRAQLEAGQAYRRLWVVVESYYSMDGTVSPLRELRSVCDAHGAGMIVDEAHALGVFGPKGAGRCAAEGVEADVVIGTFGKAVGVQGAFAASTRDAVLWLWNRARSFVFSTGVSPALCRVILGNVRTVVGDDAGRSRLWGHVELLRDALLSGGLQIAPGSVGPIVPIVVGENGAALEYEARLRARGWMVRAIRPPTVPSGSARLRVTLRASMSVSDVRELGRALVECRP